MQWAAWIPVAITAVLTVTVFVVKHRLKAGIEKSVQHKFDEKIEKIRTELRNNEERFKSDLRSKEMEISALRDGVLSGRANRQALLDKRRLEAVERVWAAVMEFTPYEFISAAMAVINFNVAAQEASRNPSVRKLFEVIGKPISGTDFPDNSAKNERPFVSPTAWAYLSAYQSVIGGAYLQAKFWK